MDADVQKVGAELSPEELHELCDLSKLAIGRVRSAVTSVVQLIERDALQSALLTSVAVDLLKGAAVLLEETANGKISIANTAIMLGVMDALGIDADQLCEMKRRSE